MYGLSRREIERIKELSKELNLDFNHLLQLAEEDLKFGCQRNLTPTPLNVNKKKLLLFQSNLFLNAFKRHLQIKKGNFSAKTVIILEKIEEIIGGCLKEKELPVDDPEVKIVLEALNDLIKSVNFRVNYIVPRQVKYLAYRDPLTNVYNRHFLREVVNRLSSKKEEFPVGIVFIDMNNLKEINDTLGHKMGDFYIKKMSEAISSSVRQSDYIFRFGGDEFIVLIPRLKENVLNKLVKRIRKNIEQINTREKLNPSFSASIGVSIWKSPEEPFQKALEQADLEMYAEKVNDKP